jgi:glycosyltransferase involved in cell wall biosynthesis
MVRYLPEFGYEPVVVTAPGPAGERWTPADLELRSHVPPSTVILRTAGPEPASSVGWRHRAERWLRLRDKWTRSWIDRSTELGIQAAAEGIDLVYAWMQPYPSGVAAAEIAAVAGIPWVADLGDPWALDEMMIYPTGLHRRLERRLMQRVLGSAAAIVTSTPEAARRLQVAFPELGKKIVCVIPNGFDPNDFSAEVVPRNDGIFRIVHTGYLHTDLGERQHRTAALRRVVGGAVRGVDILCRSHVFLIEAVERVRRDRPEIGEQIEIHFAGVLSPRDLTVAERSSASRVHGFLSHEQALALIRSADLLFLPMQDLPAGTRATVVPGKTYEYVASGRPILAALPDGDARDLLSAAGTATICRPKDVDAMAAAIVQAYERREGGDGTPNPDASLMRRFEYRQLARELAVVFDRLIDAPPPEAVLKAS